MCDRRQPRRRLFRIRLDTARDTDMLLGVGVCHERILGDALRRLLAQEESMHDHRAGRHRAAVPSS
jgi:hypothetical protein